VPPPPAGDILPAEAADPEKPAIEAIRALGYNGKELPPELNPQAFPELLLMGPDNPIRQLDHEVGPGAAPSGARRCSRQPSCLLAWSRCPREKRVARGRLWLERPPWASAPRPAPQRRPPSTPRQQAAPQSWGKPESEQPRPDCSSSARPHALQC
jgi:hypothetical protein